jgi:prolyl-tRNA synthetase
MRASKLFFKTYKEVPAEAEILSHKLLERAGYIKKLDKGLWHYTPLMWRVLKKTMNIVREEMDAAGGQEVHLPHLQPSRIWKETKRWEEYRAANILYCVNDREDRDYCLGPTAEEACTDLVKNWLTSYKQLPVNLYQITDKFRDEIRPRFAMMRAKEFIMKDAYTFSRDEKEMDEQYEIMRKAYERIFQRLELEFCIVKAHGGSIGKGKCEEFQVLAQSGEDKLLYCPMGHASNVEACLAQAAQFDIDEEEKSKEKLATPGITSIEDLSKFSTPIPAHRQIKTLIYKLVYTDREELVAIGIRGDRQINEAKINTVFGPIDLYLAPEDEVQKAVGAKPGSLGCVDMPLKYVADFTCKSMKNFACGANEDGYHFINVNFGRDCDEPEFYDFLEAEAGDACAEHSDCILEEKRGIEVGHIFNLGSKYSESMEAFYKDEQGKPKPFQMGCYGAGIGRMVQAAVEQLSDEKGIIWPKEIAPYSVVIMAAGKEEAMVEAAEKIYADCQKAGIEALYDDRKDARMGFKLKDADLIGIPLKVIVGKGFLESQEVEVENRAGDKEKLPIGSIIDYLDKKSTEAVA